MSVEQRETVNDFFFINYQNDSESAHFYFNYQGLTCDIKKFPVGLVIPRVLHTIKIVLRKKLEKDNLPSSVNATITTLDYKDVARTEIFKNIILNYTKYLFRINGIVYTIKLNAPNNYQSIKFPNRTQIFIGLPICPDILDQTSGMPIQNQCILDWYIQRNNSSEWIHLGKGDYYTPSQRDVNCKLKVIATRDNCNDSNSLITAISDPIPDNKYEFPFWKRQQYTTQSINDDDRSFRLMTYNTLAFSSSESFPYCPPKALNMNYRKILIREELRGYYADIICMQEVLEEILEYELRAKLDSNYRYIFSKRGKDTKDGLACIYNSKKFHLINHIVLNYADDVNKSEILNNIWKLITENPQTKNLLLERPDIAQILIFQLNRDENQILIVVNIHLYYHFSGDDLRLWHVILVMESVQHVYKKIQSLDNLKNISVIFCGDFNSKPLSEVFKYFISKFALLNINPEAPNNNKIFKHQFNLESAYGVPKFTNYCIKFNECIDYIFYDRDSLSILQNVPLPSETEITAHGGLPSVVFPSDHIPLITDFRFKNIMCI